MGEGGAFLLLVLGQRITELFLARRNTARLLARGGREVGADHYPLFILLHGSWLALLVYTSWDAEVSLVWFAIYLLLQGIRVWILASLGDRWTTRIIVVDEPLVRKGPYRFLDHPNYWLVAAEFVVVSMALGQLWIALVYSALNAALLWLRIRVETAALRGTP